MRIQVIRAEVERNIYLRGRIQKDCLIRPGLNVYRGISTGTCAETGYYRNPLANPSDCRQLLYSSAK